MQNAAVSANAPTPDIATKIASTMRQMGVIGLPRNYEIFYEVCTGSNEALCEELLELGDDPPVEPLELLRAMTDLGLGERRQVLGADLGGPRDEKGRGLADSNLAVQ